MSAIDSIERKGITMTIQLTSPVFQASGSIPVKYTCDGEDISPPLQWNNLPEETKSLALICEDPDAPHGNWCHWVIYNIPATTSELTEAVPAMEELNNGAKQGINDFKRVGYGGPCPPQEHGAHRYFFKLFALDTKFDQAINSREELRSAMTGHILAEGELIGTYQRAAKRAETA